MKQCSKCGEVKEFTSFHKLKDSRDGRRPDCKDCCKKQRELKNKEDVVRYKCTVMAGGIMKRVKYNIDSPKNKCYKDNDIKCTIGNTTKEIADYLYYNFYDSIKELVDEGKTPSVDRIDSDSDYSKGNIRIIEFMENVTLGLNNAVKKTSISIVAIKGNSEIVFESISEASRHLEIKRDTIYAHLDKGTLCRKGYEFKTKKEIYNMELVVVSQNGCAPCKQVYNILESEDVKFTVFNISEMESIDVQGETFTVEELDVMGTPVTILFDEGEEVARVAGVNPQGLKMLISQM